MTNSVPWDVQKCRREFPGLQRTTNGQTASFFDGPGGSQVPQRVIDAVSDSLAHHNANDGGLFATSREVGGIVDAARQGVADLLGCEDPSSIVFGPNMTTLTFALSRALASTWAPGDEIVLTRLDHDANVSPWLLAAQGVGARVRFWDIDSADCTLRVEELQRILTDRTRLVAVGVASNAVGTVNPVQEIVAHAHRVGALVFLDAVHSVPHLATDVREWNCDFLVCSAYKFFGPHLGILWGRKELLERLPAYKIRPAPETTPGRWMTGTPSFEAIAGTLAAVEYLGDLGRHQLGTPAIGRRNALVAAFESIRRYESELADRFLGQLASRPGWRLWGIGSSDRLAERVPTFGLTHARLSPQRLAEELSSRGVFVWHGHFYAPGLIERLGLSPQGMLRVGFLHYTAVEEVDRMVAILDDLHSESTC
jgi:cysteine desulfurase family protein (TIGR01976 family)